MDLLLDILRFLLGLPQESSEVAPVAVRLDGRTTAAPQAAFNDEDGQALLGWDELQQRFEALLSPGAYSDRRMPLWMFNATCRSRRSHSIRSSRD